MNKIPDHRKERHNMILPGKPDNARANVLLIVTIASRSRQVLPFGTRDENDAYAHLSSLCAEAGMNLYISHFDNVLPDSSIFSWLYKDSSWQLKKLHLSQISLSYADLPPNEPQANALRKILLEYNVAIVNDLAMSDSLTDKLLTYQLFPELIPPTIDTCERNVAGKLREMSTHSDLSFEKLFLKPRFGERGKGISVFDFSDLISESVAKKREYIVQPFLESDAGIPELNIPGRHDLRMLVYNGEIIQLFARTPAANSYVSNYACGGKILHFEINQLPKKFRELALIVDERLRRYRPRLYSVDAGIGRSGKIWLYELNTMPGIVWEEEHMAHKPKYVRVHGVITEMLKSCLR